MKRDCDYVVFTRQVRLQRADILTVQPRARGGARIFTTAHSKQGVVVLEDYAVVMELIYGGGGVGRAPVPARGLAELAAQFRDTDETLAQILLALSRLKGFFTGTAGDLSREVANVLPDTLSRRLIGSRSIGISLRRNLALFGKYLVVHAPRLRQGRTVYWFGGLRPGVEA